MKNKELRSLIFREYDSESAFARALGWSRQKVNKMTGIYEPNVQEINDMAFALNTNVEKIIQIFLSFKSPNEQQSSAQKTAPRGEEPQNGKSA